MADDFGYLNARVRARRGELLPEGFFQEALHLSFADFLRLLGETAYAPDLAGEDLESVDRAVAQHLARRVGDLPRLVTGAAREALQLLLVRADLVNVKAILRGKAAGQPAEEIKGRLAGGTLPEGILNALLEAPDAASMAQILLLPGHPLARAVREALQKTQDPFELEVELDRTFYEGLLRQAKRLDDVFLAGYLALEIDAVNLATAFKLQASGASGQADRYFVAGGRYVTLALFNRLAAAELTALDELVSTPLAPVVEARDLGALERGLRCALLDKARQGANDPLGAGLVLSYIRAKEWEAARIRLLARRAYYELPVEAVEREVFCA
ncbi:V-type ATPase subunit [Marinithermus hydrothermalis]|uniref:V-type ATP synthase subunit C n=1 Tax=Marinithermus hydrothermalis (strain DSM 14884 / JCM 11576 / T1) TaxID=869210 RepID=F2NK88_MARHT|nr:V-type ATPase subunit [Marinithermus hydrothermalis]AEB12337.1 V-type ATP synthase subunit C [Marinithermus hydrothermalis DSM 14884]